MKRLILIILFLSFSITQAQTNSVVFELNDGYVKFDSKNCLTNKTNYSKVQLSIVKGEESNLKSFKLVIKLSEEITYTFNSYNELRNTDPLSWLQGNKAFKNFKTINFAIDMTLQSDKKETQNFNVCLKEIKPKEKIVTRSLTNKKNKDYIEIPVSFATDRNDTNNTDLNDRFGTKRAALQYGRAVVSIPDTHK